MHLKKTKSSFRILALPGYQYRDLVGNLLNLRLLKNRNGNNTIYLGGQLIKTKKMCDVVQKHVWHMSTSKEFF